MDNIIYCGKCNNSSVRVRNITCHSNWDLLIKYQCAECGIYSINIIEEILVDSIKFEFATLSTYAGDEFECKATLFPSNTIYKDVEYEVSDSTLLGIIGDGKFSSKAYGKGYIYAYSPKREFVDSCEIQIYNHTTGINIDKSSASIR